MKISIITVSYNSKLTIRDTFDSVLNQTYPDIEYIVVDGRSSDGTIDIIKAYEPYFNNNIHWISEPDKGLYDAMNKGIKMATGDIVGIINSDDFYSEKNIIEIVANTFKHDSTVEAIYGDVRFVNPDNLEKTVRYYRSRNFKPWRFRFGFMPPHPSFFTYKHNFDKFGYYKTDYKIAADYELLIRFLFTNKIKYKYLPSTIMKMRTGGASTASLKSNIVLNKEIVRACRENGIYTNLFILTFKYFVKIWELIFTKQ